MSNSIILTIHNKEKILPLALDGIKKNTLKPYEIVFVLDGCSDNSLSIVEGFEDPKSSIKIIETPDIFETRANNAGIKASSGDFITIIQDDMVIKELGWDERMKLPFGKFLDVFAVTANCAHNWEVNQNFTPKDSGWSDRLFHIDHANKNTIKRDEFGVRQCVNRGPLMINHADLIKMNFFDEKFAPQDMDDHDLCFRVKKEIGKVVGCYWINYESDIFWGGTRENGQTKPWLLTANRKNCEIVYERHQDLIKNKIIDNRKC